MTQSSPHALGQAASEPTAKREPQASTSSPQRENNLHRAFSSLRQRNFRVFWLGQMISLIGTWMQSIGQVWLVYQLTHSGLQLGLLGALQAAPVLLFSLVGGVFADRWPKRRILLATQVAAMIQALVLWALIATGTIQLWHLYALATLLGFTNCLWRPASQAFIVEMVGQEDLPNAVALYFSLSMFARIVGPGIAGVIIAASGVSILFPLNAFSFLPVLAALALIRSHELHAQPSRAASTPARPSTWQSLREGLDFVRKTPGVLLIIVVVGLVLLFGSNFNVVLPLLANNVLHVGARGFGFLSAAIGVGALLATLWVAWGNRQPTIRGLLAGMLVFGGLEILLALSRIYLLSLTLIVGVGFAESVFATQSTTALQALTPDHLRGRVVGVQILFFDGSLPLGYLLMGWLAGLYGASGALLIGALLSLVVVGTGWIWRKLAVEQTPRL
jgi:MFS family permease